MTLPEFKEHLEKELELEFSAMFTLVETQTGESEREHLKEFISLKLTALVELMIQEVEGMKIKPGEPKYEFQYTNVIFKMHDEALSDIQSKLKEVCQK